jgi:hypothetical protein
MKRTLGPIAFLLVSFTAQATPDSKIDFGPLFEDFLAAYPCPTTEQCQVPSNEALKKTRREFLNQESSRRDLIRNAEDSSRRSLVALQKIAQAMQGKEKTGKLFHDLLEGCRTEVKKIDYDRQLTQIGSATAFLRRVDSLQDKLNGLRDLISSTGNSDIRRGLELTIKETYKEAYADLAKEQDALEALARSYEGKFYEAQSLSPCQYVGADLKTYAPQMFNEECGDSKGSMPREVRLASQNLERNQIAAVENAAVLARILDGLTEKSTPMTFRCPEKNRFAKLGYSYDPATNTVVNEWKIDRTVIPPGSGGDFSFHVYKTRVEAADTATLLKLIRDKMESEKPAF